MGSTCIRRLSDSCLLFAFLSTVSLWAATPTPAPLLGKSKAPQHLLILGDSLTEGYGIAKEAAFPAQLEVLLKKEGRQEIKVINAGIGGSTSASAVSRLKWHLKSKNKPKAILLALGANDGLRGLNLKESRKNLESAIQLARENEIAVLLAGMELPPNYGKDYRDQFRALYQDLAKKWKLPFFPFLLKEVGGDPTLNLADGIHPNEKGHQKIAANLLPWILKNL